MSAAHEDAEGVIVEVLLGVEFARLGEHERRVKEGDNEVKMRCAGLFVIVHGAMKFHELQLRIGDGSMMVVFVLCDSYFRNKCKPDVVRVRPILQNELDAFAAALCGSTERVLFGGRRNQAVVKPEEI